MKKNKIEGSVRGKSVQQVLDMDINSLQNLSTESLKMHVSRLISTANKRLKRLKTSSPNSPALRSFEELGINKFSIRNKDYSQIMKTYAQVRRFLTHKTSTVKGSKEYFKSVRQELRKHGYKGTLEEGQINRLFEAFHKAQKAGLIAPSGSEGSKQFRDYILENAEDLVGTDIENTINKLNNAYTDFYEEMFEDEDEDMFELDTEEDF